MNSSTTTIFLCPDTVDGLYTAIYKAWEAGTSHTDIQVKHNDTLSFLYNYIEVETDISLAVKVAESIIKKLGEEVYYYVFRTALSNDSDKGSLLYHFLIKAFRTGPDIISQLADDDVNKVFKLTRYVWKEQHNYLGFVRFEELSSGVLISRIKPVNNVIPIIMEHFSDRLQNENWIILDTGRNLAAIHAAKKRAVLSYALDEEQLLAFDNYSDDEEKFKGLWNRFFDTIAIDERYNPNLQRNLMPIRYREYMNITES